MYFDICIDFTVDDLQQAARSLKSDNIPGSETIHPTFLMHLGSDVYDAYKYPKSGVVQTLWQCSSRVRTHHKMVATFSSCENTDLH